MLLPLQDSNPALRLKEEVIAANTLMGTGLTAFSSSGSGSESGYESDSDKRRIPIDVDPVDGIDDIDEVKVINVPGTF